MVKATAEEKGKGKAVEVEDEVDEEEEEEVEDEEGDEEGDDNDEVNDDEEEEEEEEEQQPKKKAKMEASSSTGKKAHKKSKSYGSDDEGGGTIEGLEGDDVDPSLIIPGGRASRRGRATFTPADFRNMPADSDSD